jgi:hypothetical protein
MTRACLFVACMYSCITHAFSCQAVILDVKAYRQPTPTTGTGTGTGTGAGTGAGTPVLRTPFVGVDSR